MRGSAAFRVAVAPGGALAGPWVQNSLWTAARAVPSLDLRFAANKNLVDATTGQNLVTFTRASSGTYVGSNGLVKTATTNLLLRSEEFNDASWTKTRSSVTANAITAPNGTLTGDKLIDSTDASASHFISQSISFVSGTTYTTSIFAKQGEIRYLRLGFNATPFGTTQVVFFDLLNGVISSNPNALAASITNAGDGWWRLTVTATATSTASDLILISLSSNGTSISFTGTGTNGLYIWGAQLEQSSTANEYIPTTSTINSAPRFDHNPTTGESLGLLVEEARTNLSQQSENFSDVYWAKTDCTITSNESTAPDGTLTADLWTNTATPGVVQNNLTKDATARTYTGSLWVKGNVTAFTLSIDAATTANRGRVIFNLSNGTLTNTINDGTFTNTSGTITAYADNWYRLTVTTTTSTGTSIRLRAFFSNVGATARIWGAQVEEGAFATSYIPTTTATVTRSADVASITGANFSSWYRQDEGTVFAELAVSQPSVGGNQFVFRAGDNTYSNAIALNIPGQAQLSTASGGTFDGSASSVASLVANVPAKIGAAYATNNLGISLNGATAVTDTSATMPTALNRADIGSDHAGVNRVKACTIRRLTYWPTRLSNTTLQQVTQ